MSVLSSWGFVAIVVFLCWIWAESCVWFLNVWFGRDK